MAPSAAPKATASKKTTAPAAPTSVSQTAMLAQPTPTLADDLLAVDPLDMAKAEAALRGVTMGECGPGAVASADQGELGAEPSTRSKAKAKKMATTTKSTTTSLPRAIPDVVVPTHPSSATRRSSAPHPAANVTSAQISLVSADVLKKENLDHKKMKAEARAVAMVNEDGTRIQTRSQSLHRQEQETLQEGERLLWSTDIVAKMVSCVGSCSMVGSLTGDRSVASAAATHRLISASLPRRASKRASARDARVESGVVFA